MDIFEYAMQMEKDGERYYRELAEKSPDRGISRILTMLADQETMHFDVLQTMKRGENTRIEEGTFRANVRNIFQELQDSNNAFVSSSSQIDLYRKAQELEQKSRDFYLANAEEAGSSNAKDVLLKIAHEEKLHYDMLGTMIDFISQPEPGRWLENAEWYHTDDY